MTFQTGKHWSSVLKHAVICMNSTVIEVALVYALSSHVETGIEIRESSLEYI